MAEARMSAIRLPCQFESSAESRWKAGAGQEAAVQQKGGRRTAGKRKGPFGCGSISLRIFLFRPG